MERINYIKTKNQEIAFGIDFGTTCSLVANYDNKDISIIKSEFGENTFSSSVCISDSGDILACHNRCKCCCFIKSIKRFIGKDSAKQQHCPYELGKNGSIYINGFEFNSHAIASSIFLKLKKAIFEKYKISKPKCVVTVPAYYDETSKSAISSSAKKVGIEVIRLLSEPTAAAVAYKELLDIDNGRYMVYDLGGGTFDISIVDVFQGVYKVLGVAGDSFLGGDDVDYNIAKSLNSNYLNNNIFLNAVCLAKEKVCMGKKESCFCFENKTYNVSLDLVSNCSKETIEKTLKISNSLLEDLGIGKEDIKSLILVGGSTYLCGLEESVASTLGIPISSSVNRREAVVIGAAIYANLLLDRKKALIDVVPMSLGIEVFGGGVERIIDRNSNVPISVSKVFSTISDKQDEIKISVCQGESERVVDNKVLKTFFIKDFVKDKAGNAKIEVRFTFDVNGILVVEAIDLHSNTLSKVLIDSAL